MKTLLLLITMLVSFNMYAQSYLVGHVSVNFKDSSRTTNGYTISGGVTMAGSGRTIGTEIFYPAVASGNSAAVANGQFPVVVFGHGFAMSYNSYSNVYDSLVKLGYIILLPRTEGGIFPSPSHSEFGDDLKLLAMQGLALNVNSLPNSTVSFVGKVKQAAAIGGHSMGAGASFLAGANNTNITCIFNFAVATTNPSSITAAAFVTVPTLIISGQKDNVADTTVQNSHYSATSATTKFHTIIKDVTHCDFGTGTSSTCNFGQASCSNAGCNSVLFNRYMTYLVPFLGNLLKEVCTDGPLFMDSIISNSPNRVGTKITGRLACVISAINQNNIEQVNYNVYPNPTNNMLTISFKPINTSPTIIKLYDILGRLILTDIETTAQLSTIEKHIDLQIIDNGIYFMTINEQYKLKIIKN
ncbi:MAG: T9SS type A sorting domain-containing protein [Bacteroidia bacterium]|nr:T9SS type A sorting domain-containing protein [Bacteroidia bacterium]